MRLPESIEKEIIQRVANDQAEMMIVQPKPEDGYHPAIRKVHEENASFLKDVLDEYGLITVTITSKKVVEAAFIIIQHAISKPTFMKECLGLMKVSSNVDPVHIAYLTDRILTLTGQPQHYGTQFDYDHDGYMKCLPLDAPREEVNQRRFAIGLSSLEENEQRFIHQKPITPELAKQRYKDMQAWLKETGWI